MLMLNCSTISLKLFEVVGPIRTVCLKNNKFLIRQFFSNKIMLS